MRKKRRQIDMPPSYVIEHLDEAIAKHWVRVHYQPIVRTISGQLCAMEGLARWDDPNWGFLTPPFFISILEQHNLIHKLDAFLIEEVCRNQARVRKAGMPSVPVSLNLSRLDFINCDIFAIVERAVRKYNVPRDLLHLEIVENILTDRNKKIGEVLDRFRAAGYEIWMDDFGSGYSSLKFLKDQRFDLLKMDMAFLKSDTQRARDIIISIISMDKRIGNRTLAEGVETQEQFEFLREIGCEKIQGYYLGRPRPYDETIHNCLEKGITVELGCWKAYYDAIMDVNFLTGHALLLIEYRDHAYHILFANQKSRELFWQGDAERYRQWEEALNTYTQPSMRYLRRGLHRVMLNGEDEELAYPLNGDFVMMDCHRVISYSGRCLLAVDCRLHKIAHEGDLFRPAYFLRNLFYLYDKVATINLTKHEIIELTQPQLRSGLHKLPLGQALAEYAEQSIYHADRKRFADFFDFKTIPERVAASKLGSIVEAFRTKGPDGTLIWKTHRIARIASSEQDIYFCVVRVSDAQDMSHYEEKCRAQYVLPSDGAEDSMELLWKNFITVYGSATGALPDGRKAGAPFAPGANPSYGAEQNGLLASLNSVAKLPYEYALDGISNTQTIAPETLGHTEADRIATLVRVMDGYFKQGAHHLNVNVFGVDKLIDCMEHPEKPEYANFTIRVSGYAVKFIDLTRQQQLDVISRRAHQKM